MIDILKKCNYINIETIAKFYGTDWSNLILKKGIRLSNRNLRDITLPIDTELFQKAENKSLYICSLPSMDYSAHNFDGVNMQGCTFGIQSILPATTRLFQDVEGKSIRGCTLPTMNYSRYDFRNVDIIFCKFTEDSTLPSDVDFFQKIKDKCLLGCKLPSQNYSNYDFTGVYISCCDFGSKSLLPSDVDFFQKIKDKNLGSCTLPYTDYSTYNLTGVKLGESNLIEFICRNVVKYDLNQFETINFSNKKYIGLMNEKQANIIKVRYAERISDGTIVLPTILKEHHLDVKGDNLI